MDIAPLKAFAVWARTSLIREVNARITVVLAPSSPDRVERPKSVAALEKAVATEGGGDTGKAVVADRVAYTWFNRIIALRFMDANGYTGIGVVSPQGGVQAGQPEVLAEAKRGNVDDAVVSPKALETVMSLLNGTRRSDDPQGEAYALLLAEYCRYWNRAMPFMFEREGDFTELLIPSGLLADDSVLNRAVEVLTVDVCRDVEVIGWLYQFYIADRKDEVFAGFKKHKKAGAAEIPSATQLFTPHWIVRYLVENSLGRLWMLNRPSSHLISRMEYYVAPIDEEADFLKIGGPEEIKILDPCCGSGHMLTYAFDLVYAMYEEEGYAPSEIPGLILTKNLYGTEIDPRSGALAAFALTMKARARQRTFFSRPVEPNVVVIEPISFTPQDLDVLLTAGGDHQEEIAFWNQFELADTCGSLIKPDAGLTARLQRHLETLDEGGDLLVSNILQRAERAIIQSAYLTPLYAVVVTNPPYMGNKTMGTELAEFAKHAYPLSKSDLYAMFLERCIGLSVTSGFVGVVAMHSWMFLSTYANLRQVLLEQSSIATLAHLGPGAFDTITGEIVQTAAVIFECSALPNRQGSFFDVTSGRKESEKSERLRALVSNTLQDGRFEVAVSEISQVPGKPIAYWLSHSARSLFANCQPLGERVHITGGMTTGDNERFLRLWFEVSQHRSFHSALSAHDAMASGRRWFPYNKGGGARSWFGNRDYYVNWQNDGAEILSTGRATPRSRSRYFQEALTYSATGSASLSIRYSDPGFLFDAKGSSCFSDSGRLLEHLGFLASSTASYLLRALNPTIEFQTGDLSRLPCIETSTTGVVDRLIALSREDESRHETCWDFQGSPLVQPGVSTLQAAEEAMYLKGQADVNEFRRLVELNNEAVANAAGLVGEVPTSVSIEEVTLDANPVYRFGAGRSASTYRQLTRAAAIADFVSYGVGCIFGRYSLDAPGLILADQGATLQEYLSKVPNPSFSSDPDNVVPVVDGDWFEDDIAARFRQFLRAAFGEQHFEENLRFVTEALGVKDIRDYFVKSFYKDHVQRYRKRPIYWLFSSPKGSFNALVYMHRYTSSTVSTVLNEYLREFRAKLAASLQQQERLAGGEGTPRQQAAADKEADRLRKVLLELEEYEHDVLYPLASQQVAIDLDDGVKSNYPKFGTALKKIPGLEASSE
ncbi:BREX-1 system adenine-specific DNA-methyltransferase PglX [Mycolicibacterium fortuitum]|nr:BREX-1 system adenine-specific DNA-methyltransferase PglX [Mycolicibacterium fortuitum]